MDTPIPSKSSLVVGIEGNLRQIVALREKAVTRLQAVPEATDDQDIEDAALLACEARIKLYKHLLKYT